MKSALWNFFARKVTSQQERDNALAASAAAKADVEAN